MAFSGEYEAPVRKKRIRLPTELQAGLGNRFFIVGLPFWPFLALYPEASFDQMMESLEDGVSPVDPVFINVLPQLGARSFPILVGEEGRFTIPSNLQTFLSEKMVFVGSGRTVRLYKADIWRVRSQEDSAYLQKLAEHLAGTDKAQEKEAKSGKH